jgi:hypothetical protein
VGRGSSRETGETYVHQDRTNEIRGKTSEELGRTFFLDYSEHTIEAVLVSVLLLGRLGRVGGHSDEDDVCRVEVDSEREDKGEGKRAAKKSWWSRKTGERVVGVRLGSGSGKMANRGFD